MSDISQGVVRVDVVACVDVLPAAFVVSDSLVPPLGHERASGGGVAEVVGGQVREGGGEGVGFICAPFVAFQVVHFAPGLVLTAPCALVCASRGGFDGGVVGGQVRHGG